MSTDRLAELQRQRALAQAQVDWFDREITRLRGKLPDTTPPTGPAVANAGETRLPAGVARPTPPEDADAIIARFSQPPESSVADVKRGCFLYAGIAMGLLVFVTVAAYFYYTHGR